MTDSALAIAVPLIARFEGFRATPYQDVAGVYTIGYGFTYTPDFKRVTATTPDMTQTAAQAWLEAFVSKTLAAVRQMVCVPITDNQAAALTSICYNEGTQAIRSSRLMLALNQGLTQEAADGFLSWVYAGGRPNAGLQARRRAERALFLTAVHAPAPAEDEADRLDDQYNPTLAE